MSKRKNKSQNINDKEFNDFFEQSYVKKLEREINYIFSVIVGVSATSLAIISAILQYDSLNIEGTVGVFLIFKNPIVISGIVGIELFILSLGLLLTFKKLKTIDEIEEEMLKRQLLLNKNPKYDELKKSIKG